MSVIAWFVTAGAVLLLELHSGTVYLLAIALAASVAGAAAIAGMGLEMQFALAAVAASIGCYVAHGVRRRQALRERPAVTEEAGQHVSVVRPGAEPRVNWRGTEWDAVLEDGSPATAQEQLKILRQEGNRLILAR